MDPFRHYLNRGRREGRAPSTQFDPKIYLAASPDLAREPIDPVIHFIEHGRREGRPASVRAIIAGSGLFDAEFYRAANPDVILSGRDFLQHYIEYGEREGRRPSLDFDPHTYLAANPDVAQMGQSPLQHYIASGRVERRHCRGPGLTSQEFPAAVSEVRSSGLFDDAFYLQQCPAVKKAGIDPLLHYLTRGFLDHLEISSALSMREYAHGHPEIRTTGLPPLLYLLRLGLETGTEESLALAAARLTATPSARPLPDDAISLERMAGVAYFNRFEFPTDSAESPGAYVTDAIVDLACRSVQLKVERIEPDISIIIPVFGQLHFVLNCLDSLAKHRSRFSVEVIVIDDESPQATQAWRLGAIPWVRYRRQEHNTGFIDTCNDAAKIARGRFLVFLNSDTRVAAGWLDELIGSFEIFPKAGLVGSKLYNTDGTLQEAGGIYWRDGSAWNYGRNQDANHPKYCFARRVDYISGASIAVPTEIWRTAGGFNASYRPAYCEDADLAFKLREMGYQVWLQPLSAAIHYEGKTQGRDLATGIKAYQQINMRRLAKRWKSALSAHRQHGHEPDQEANRPSGERLLVLDAVTPRPDQDSGSFITFRMLQSLQTLGYQITFVPQHNYAYDGAYTDDLQRIGIECIHLPHFRNITEVLDFRNDFDIALVYRFGVLKEVYEELRSRLPKARVILHNVDLHFLREERAAAMCNSRSKKIVAALTRSAELELMCKVDCTIVHTAVEAEIIKRLLPIDNIVEFPYIAELHRTQAAFEDRHDVLFLGGFGHPPNIDAVQHFVANIWPLVVPQLPERSRFVIIGASPPSEIQLLAGERIVVTGHVKDLQPYFDSARVFVAPIRYGAGIKGKVIQSLCHGTPSVITSIAAEGIGLTSGRETIIANADAEFAQSIVRVYSDRTLWHILQESGYRFVEERFSWKRGIEICRKVLDTADATWLARKDREMHRRLNYLVKKFGAN